MDFNSISSSAYQGLQIAQAGILVTSQNVNGSNVDGYSKRNANAVVSQLANNALNLNGTAFAVNGFVREYSALINGQLINAQANSSYTDTMVQYTATINSLVADPSAGLGNSIANFFSSLGTYAANPTSSITQAAMTGAANQVSANMAGMVSMVSQLGTNAQSGLQDTVNQVNTLLPQLAAVNRQIVSSNAGGNNAGVSADILDQRDSILSKLQMLIGGQSLINSDGTATQIVGGLPLVERGFANVLQVMNPASPILSVQFAPATVNGGGSIQQIKSGAGGQAGGLMDLTLKFVPLLNQRLNTIAQSLVSIANNSSGASTASNGALSIFGFNVDGVTKSNTKAVTGDLTNQIPVITETSMATLYAANGTSSSTLVTGGLTAANFVSLAPSNPSGYMNTAGLTPTPFITSSLANTIANMGTILGNAVANLVSDVGTQVATWSSNQKANSAIVNSLTEQKNAVSGVNLDEEAANLLKFQQLYSASSKVLQVGNQMFDSILSIMN